MSPETLTLTNEDRILHFQDLASLHDTEGSDIYASTDVKQVMEMCKRFERTFS